MLGRSLSFSRQKQIPEWDLLTQAELRAFGVTVLKMTEPVSLDLYKAEASTQFDIVLEESNDPLVTGVPVAEAFKYQGRTALKPGDVVQAVNGVPVKSSAEATRRIQQAAPGVLQLLIMPAGVRERIKADAKLRSGAQTPEASPKPVKERVPLTRRLSFSRRRSSSKGVAKDADDATGGDAASKDASKDAAAKGMTSISNGGASTSGGASGSDEGGVAPPENGAPPTPARTPSAATPATTEDAPRIRDKLMDVSCRQLILECGKITCETPRDCFLQWPMTLQILGRKYEMKQVTPSEALPQLVNIVGRTTVEQATLVQLNMRQKVLPKGWISYVDTSGKPCFYNVYHRTVSFEKPKGKLSTTEEARIDGAELRRRLDERDRDEGGNEGGDNDEGFEEDRSGGTSANNRTSTSHNISDMIINFKQQGRIAEEEGGNKNSGTPAGGSRRRSFGGTIQTTSL